MRGKGGWRRERREGKRCKKRKLRRKEGCDGREKERCLLGQSEDLKRSRSQAPFCPLWELLDQLNLSFPVFRFVLYHASDNLIGYIWHHLSS